jgi:hypothetical protein
MRDPHWDHDYGRIWRIVHTGKPIVKDWPKIEGAPAEELCQLLLHEQNIVRHHARIELRKIINLGTNLFKRSASTSSNRSYRCRRSLTANPPKFR